MIHLETIVRSRATFENYLLFGKIMFKQKDKQGVVETNEGREWEISKKKEKFCSSAKVAF